MSKAPSERNCPVVRPGDLKCVWMTAGVLSYQLCDRELECEGCPLDRAMRMHFGSPAAADREAAPPAPDPGRLAADRRYSRGHCWVLGEEAAVRGARRVRVGIEPGLARVLPRPHSVVLPSPGATLVRGHPHVWVVAEGGTFALQAPLAGTVVAANPAIAESPSRIASDAFGGGWLYLLDATAGPQFRGLLDTRAAGTNYAVDARRFRTELVRALRRHGDRTGPALADGGAPLSDLGEMLGPSRYLELLVRVYG